MKRSLFFHRIFNASALHAAKLALYQRGLASGAFYHRSGPVDIERVDFWIVLPGDYGYDSATPIAGSARLYGEC
tara:strand:+ start:3138 stop:3359 length:222 start_codon:yes stop_codon:yes gene_type:complete